MWIHGAERVQYFTIILGIWKAVLLLDLSPKIHLKLILEIIGFLWVGVVNMYILGRLKASVWERCQTTKVACIPQSTTSFDIRALLPLVRLSMISAFASSLSSSLFM